MNARRIFQLIDSFFFSLLCTLNKRLIPQNL